MSDTTAKEDKDSFERGLKLTTNQSPVEFREELIRFNRRQTDSAVVARRPAPEISPAPTMPIVREVKLTPNPIKLDLGSESDGTGFPQAPIVGTTLIVATKIDTGTGDVSTVVFQGPLTEIEPYAP